MDVRGSLLASLVFGNFLLNLLWRTTVTAKSIMAKSYLSRDSNDVVLARKVLWKPIQHDTVQNVLCKLCVYASSRNELLRPVWKRYGNAFI